MDTQLNTIINKIKQDGVEEAEKKAKEIVESAEKQAETIIKAAKDKETQMLENAEKEAFSFTTNSKNLLKQAARDVLLGLKERVVEFFDRVVKGKVEETLDTDVLKKAIIKIADNFSPNKDLKLEVVLSEQDKKSLEKTLFNAMKKQSKEFIQLKKSEQVKKGFRIGEKDKYSYIDFTNDGIAEIFKSYLNPKLIEMLDIDLGAKKKSDR